MCHSCQWWPWPSPGNSCLINGCWVFYWLLVGTLRGYYFMLCLWPKSFLHYIVGTCFSSNSLVSMSSTAEIIMYTKCLFYNSATGAVEGMWRSVRWESCRGAGARLTDAVVVHGGIVNPALCLLDLSLQVHSSLCRSAVGHGFVCLGLQVLQSCCDLFSQSSGLRSVTFTPTRFLKTAKRKGLRFCFIMKTWLEWCHCIASCTWRVNNY